MRGYLTIGVIAAALAPLPALAQEVTTSFRGIRVEGDVGGDRFQAEGDHHTKLGYGGTVGFDGMIGDRIVIGAEGSYWREGRHGNSNCAGFDGGVICQTSFHELGAAVRAGYLVTPRLLVFGKGGYVNDRQRNAFASSTGFYVVNGLVVGPGYASAVRSSLGGYQVGGGVEFSLTDMFYVTGQYVYSRYDNRTSRQRAFAGVGVRFK